MAKEKIIIDMQKRANFHSECRRIFRTRTGAVPSLIDTATLEYYMHKMNLK